YDTDQEVHVLRDVRRIAHVRAVQPFVEEHVRVRLCLGPVRKGAGVLRVARSFGSLVQVPARSAAAGFAVLLEARRELVQQIRYRTEVTEGAFASRLVLLHRGAHSAAVVTMKGVAFDHGSLDVLPAEDVLEAAHDGGRARSR